MCRRSINIASFKMSLQFPTIYQTYQPLESLKVSSRRPCREEIRRRNQIQSFWTSVPYGDDQPHDSGCFTQRERAPSTHWIGGRPGRNFLGGGGGNPVTLRIRTAHRPVRSTATSPTLSRLLVWIPSPFLVLSTLTPCINFYKMHKITKQSSKRLTKDNNTSGIQGISGWLPTACSTHFKEWS